MEQLELRLAQLAYHVRSQRERAPGLFLRAVRAGPGNVVVRLRQHREESEMTELERLTADAERHWKRLKRG